ncbi:MAG: hypothetical protein Fur0010_04880 [Bdellovibrio sp.]
MTPQVSDKFAQSFLLSIASHLFFALVFSVFAPHMSIPQIDLATENRFEVKTLSEEEMNRYRTVGVKNGRKDFTSPVDVPKSLPRPKPTKAKTSPSLKDLGAGVEQVQVEQRSSNNTKRVLEEKSENNPFQVKVSEGTKGLKKAQILKERKETLENDYAREIGVSPDDQRFLKSTGFNIDFTPPEGVSEDELNTMEKIYYSFQKRTFYAYVNSFIKSYNATEIKRPQLRKVLESERHTLTGRITFDEEGNIVAIKILQSSPNDDIHMLFEETLKGIQRLPNPPRDLIKDGEITIYYQLRIN